MPRYSGGRRSSVRSSRRRRSRVTWQESRVRRDAAVAAARAADVVMGGNTASRGLILARGEYKAVDVTATVDVDTDTTVALLNGIARGDDIHERNAREVVMKSIQFSYNAYGTATTGIDQHQRVMLVYDRQTNATELTAAQVLTAVDTLAPRNLENRKRFKILYDRCHSLNAVAEPGSHVTRRFYRRLRHPVTFNSGDAGSVADIVTGSLYLIVIGTVAPGATAGSVTFSSRIRYLDA